MDADRERRARFTALATLEENDADPAGLYTDPECKVREDKVGLWAQVWVHVPYENLFTVGEIRKLYGEEATR